MAIQKCGRNIRAHPTAIYYFAPANQKRLKTYLEENGLASRWEDFEAALHTHTKNEAFSQHHLVHELGISEFFLALEHAASEETPKLIFWERTSPFSRDIGGGELEENGEKLHFNPDAFFALHYAEKGFRFFFLEYDNNTARAEKYRKKLQGYIAYRRQEKFSALLQRYAEKYHLPIKNFEKPSFRVLSVTPDVIRRDQLFLDSLTLKSFKMLWYGSIEDFASDPFARLWLRGKEFAPIAAALDNLPKNTVPAIRRDLLREQMKAMARVSLLD